MSGGGCWVAVFPAQRGVSIADAADNSQPVEEREERVGRLVPARWRPGRGGPLNRPLLELVVGVEINLGGFGALVAEPQRDREDVDVAGTQEHRVGVAEH